MSRGIEIPSCKCERCGYTWYLRYPQKPRVCPNCKSPYWQSSSDLTNELNIDLQKAQNVIKELTEKIEETAEKQTGWALIIKEGWQRMFETSELPILHVDKILESGFSVHEWFMNGSKISLGLAESVAVRFLSMASPLKNVKEDVIERAKDALEWRRILEIVDQDTAKVMGLIWYADKLSIEIRYPETEVFTQENVWQLLEKNLGKKKHDLISHVEYIIGEIDETYKDVTSWADIIRFV